MAIKETSLDDRRAAMREALAHVLGNTCRLFRTALCCAWNTGGRGAIEAAALFRAQARELFEAQEPISERILCVGGLAVPDDGEGVIVARPAEIDFRDRSATRFAALLIGGHEGSLMSLRAGADVAREIDDCGAQVLLAGRILAHEGHVVRLRKLIA